MSIIKIKSIDSEFTLVPNKTINDDLSWGAIGVLVFLCSKPSDWEISVKQLIEHSKGTAKKTGRDGTYSIIAELQEKGYLRRTQNKKKDGKFNNFDYEASLLPLTDNTETVPLTDSPHPSQPTQQSKDINKEKNIHGTSNDEPQVTSSKKNIPHDEILALYRRCMTPELRDIAEYTPKRKRLVRSFFEARTKASGRNYTIENLEAYFKYIKINCQWMLHDRPNGKGGYWKKKDFDYLFSERCYLGVKENRFDDMETA